MLAIARTTSWGETYRTLVEGTNFRCMGSGSSTVCYGIGPNNFEQLQFQVNQYAADAGRAPVTLDAKIGRNTLALLQFAAVVIRAAGINDSPMINAAADGMTAQQAATNVEELIITIADGSRKLRERGVLTNTWTPGDVSTPTTPEVVVSPVATKSKWLLAGLAVVGVVGVAAVAGGAVWASRSST